MSPALSQQATESAKPAPATDNETRLETSASKAEDADAAATAALIAKTNAAAGGKSTAEKPVDDAAFFKKAKGFGWNAEDRHGTTVYCREAPVIGSHFTEKKCALRSQLALVLEQQEFERDQLKQRGCGGNCGSK